MKKAEPFLPTSHRHITDDELRTLDAMLCLRATTIIELKNAETKEGSDKLFSRLGQQLAEVAAKIEDFCNHLSTNCAWVPHATKLNLFETREGMFNNPHKRLFVKELQVTFSTPAYHVMATVRGDKAHLEVEEYEVKRGEFKHPSSLMGSVEDIALQFFQLLPPRCRVERKFIVEEKREMEGDQPYPHASETTVKIDGGHVTSRVSHVFSGETVHCCSF